MKSQKFMFNLPINNASSFCPDKTFVQEVLSKTKLKLSRTKILSKGSFVNYVITLGYLVGLQNDNQ